jgi:outer membrane receptor protein involved in Fe transport
VSPRLVLLDSQRTHPQQSGAFRSDDPTERQTIPGYTLLNLDLQYELSRRVRLYMKAKNLLDQRYRTVNLGAAPEGLEQGSAAVEFERGAPQHPLRVSAGLSVLF